VNAALARRVIGLIAIVIALGAAVAGVRTCSRVIDDKQRADSIALAASFRRLDSAAARAQAAFQQALDSVQRVARSWAVRTIVERGHTDTLLDTLRLDTASLRVIKERFTIERKTADSTISAERNVSSILRDRVSQDSLLEIRLRRQRDSAMTLATRRRPGPIVVVGPAIGAAWTDGPVPRGAACLCAMVNLGELAARVRSKLHL
jgi:hypothetical protein